MASANNNILKAMLDRATNPADDGVDELAVQLFCVAVRNDPNLIPKATDLLVSQIQSTNITKSIRALMLLDECMAKCGNYFQDEISKFRFLNDLIRLVSKKYLGEKTPSQIREKIMDCLLLWTTEYPHKTKIREAYDLLRKEDNENETSINTVKRDNLMGPDEEKFCKLLQSKNSEDLKRANLLIQARVYQDEKRTELMRRHKTELEQIGNTVTLLGQMLDSNIKNVTVWEDDSVSLIKELYEACENYVPIIEQLPQLIENTNEELFVKTMEINERLHAVIERYKTFVFQEEQSESQTSQRLTQPTTSMSTSDLLSDLLAQPTNRTESLSPRDELSKIFEKCGHATSKTDNFVFSNMELLEPITITESEHRCLEKVDGHAKPKYDSIHLKDIDILSEELLKENLQTLNTIKSFKKEPERKTLNDLAREKVKKEAINPPPVLPVVSIDSVLNVKDDICQTNRKVDRNFIQNNLNDPILTEKKKAEKSFKTVEKDKNPLMVHLADINVDLDDVSPTNEKQLLDDDIKITLNFTSNRPSPNVSVIVVSVTNQSKLPVTNFQFDASVRKPSKVRLLPATGDYMPGIRPFRPATPINQVMLVFNPTKSDVDVTCIVGYKLGDDPDPIKDSIVAENIAYVE